MLKQVAKLDKESVLVVMNQKLENCMNVRVEARNSLRKQLKR